MCVWVCVCAIRIQCNVIINLFPISARGADAAKSYRNLLNIPKGNLSDPLTD